MGPGMMWGEGYDAGYGMMGDCWDNDDWNNNNKSNLNLTQEQQNQWDNIRNKRREYQRAVNDSLNFYAQQIHRLQSRKSNLAKEDMSYIKSILTPEQYRLFLEKLLNLN